MYINAMYIHPNHLTNSRLPDGPPPPCQNYTILHL